MNIGIFLMVFQLHFWHLTDVLIQNDLHYLIIIEGYKALLRESGIQIHNLLIDSPTPKPLSSLVEGLYILYLL